MFYLKKIVFSALFLFVLLSVAYGKETWMVSSLDWQPYSGSDMANLGNSVQKLKLGLEERDVRLIVEFYPWLRAQMKAKQKDYIGYFPAWPEEVQEGFVASNPIDWSVISLMKRRDMNIHYGTLDEVFENLKVGVISTYVYPKSIQFLIDKYPKNVEKSPNENALMKKLSVGVIDIGITDPNVMLYLASKEGIDNIEEFFDVEKKELVVSLRDTPDNQKVIKIINEIFSEE